MKTCKRAAVVLVCLLAAMMPLLRCLSTTAYAQAELDETRKGSITVTMQAGTKAVPGGELTLYRVGEVRRDQDWNYSFVPTGKFTAWVNYTGKKEFGDIESADHSAKTAESLAQFVNRNQSAIEGTPGEIGGDGTVTFPGLELGLYLLVQTEAADGYHQVSPFLVSVPYLYNGRYVYDVDANSKAELNKKPDPTQANNPTTPGKPSSKLPQTGQLNWPVPVMVILGMALFAMGWMLRFRKRDDNAQ